MAEAETNMILIKISTGSRGVTSYRGLSALKNKTRHFDRRLTWGEAFQKYFNVTVDPERYYVQRHPHSRKPEASTKRGLGEEISVLISEFKKVKQPFLIFLMDKQRLRKGQRISGEITSVAPTRPTPQRKPPPVAVALSPSVTCAVSPPPKFRATVPRNEETINRGRRERQQEMISSGDVGDDVKEVFCENAKRNVSNTQFLKAQHELQELKRNGSRWAKWTTYAPMTSNIFRDLLDV